MAYRDRFKRMVDKNVEATKKVGTLTDAQRIDLNEY
jgi:hypothetical protein